MPPRKHKFASEQRVEVQSDEYPPVVEVAVLLPAHCEAHRAPMYGCVHGDNSFSFCEELLKPLSPTNKKRLN